MHMIESNTGAESLAGISRSLALIANYAATGVIRQRMPFSPEAAFYITGIEPGSLNFKYKAIIGTLALGLGGNGLYDLSKYVLNRAVGQHVELATPAAVAVNEQRGGDVEALVEAVEPALKRAHYGIGRTSNRIIVIDSSDQTVVVNFDSRSKEYLDTSIPSEDDVQDVSVSALNANDRTGRVYLFDIGKTVPFKISSDARPRTIGNLSSGLDAYARKRGATVNIVFQRIEAPDGRLKRIIIYDAADIQYLR